MNLAVIGFRNLARNKIRTLLTIAGVTVSIVAFASLRSMTAAWNNVEGASGDRLSTFNRWAFSSPLPLNYVATLRSMPGVRAVSFTQLFVGRDPRRPEYEFQTIAVDKASFLEVFDEITLPPDQRQRWLEDRQGVIVGETLARELNLTVGTRVTLEGTITRVFNIQGIFTSARQVVDPTLLIADAAYIESTRIHQIHTRLVDPSQVSAVITAIDATFAVKPIPTRTMTERAYRLSASAMASEMLVLVDVISFVSLFILVMVLGNTTAMGVRERTKEYGSLRAIGFLPRQVRMSILWESVALGSVAGVLGVALAYPIIEFALGAWLQRHMATVFPDFTLMPSTAALGFLAACAMSLISALIPAYRAGSLGVAEALRSVD